LKPRSDDAPSGEDLEYDPLFTALELAGKPGEERQEGDKILPAEDPDWSDVEDKAVAVLAESHDLRAAVYYGRAVLYSDGLSGLDLITTYIVGLLEQYWDTCHPQLDEDDGDPTMRINAIQGLAGSDQVIKSLRRTSLTASRMFGKMSLRDMEIADGTIVAPDDMDGVPDSSAISAAFQDSDADELQAMLAAAISIRSNAKRIEEIFNEQTPGQGPTLDELVKTTDAIIKRLTDAVGGDGTDAGDGETVDGQPGEVPQSAGRGAPISGNINSPADVSVALDKIIGYYKRAEPSSPVPILLERAKKLVGADFLTIMNDMAPRGLETVNIIGGFEDE
jgi:type VI secretion system protein ImpA